jgi:hypothetical protein
VEGENSTSGSQPYRAEITNRITPEIPTKLPHPGEAATKEASVEEEAVLIKGRDKTGGVDEGRSIISAVTGVSEEADERGKGMSGWIGNMGSAWNRSVCIHESIVWFS